jgi:hypothetical protein
MKRPLRGLAVLFSSSLGIREIDSPAAPSLLCIDDYFLTSSIMERAVGGFDLLKSYKSWRYMVYPLFIFFFVRTGEGEESPSLEL